MWHHSTAPPTSQLSPSASTPHRYLALVGPRRPYQREDDAPTLTLRPRSGPCFVKGVARVCLLLLGLGVCTTARVVQGFLSATPLSGRARFPDSGLSRPELVARESRGASHRVRTQSTLSPTAPPSPFPIEGGRSAPDDVRPVHYMNKRMLYLARRRDFNQVMKTLYELEGSASKVPWVKPNVYTFNAVMNACVLCQCTDERMEELWDRMRGHGIKPNAITYNIKLKKLFRRVGKGTVRRALAVLDEMRLEGVDPDLTTFNEVINICVENGETEAANKLVETMETMGIEPDVTTYTTMIKGYGLEQKPSSLDLAFDCLHAMKARQLHLNRYTCNVLADACIRCKQPARALKVLRDFEEQSRKMEEEEQQQQQQLEELVDREKEEQKRLRLKAKSFNIRLKAHREMGDVKGGFKALEEMRRQGLQPTTVTYNTLIDSCSRTGYMPAARALLAEMTREGVTVDLQTVNPFLYGEVVASGASVDEALEMTNSLLSRYRLEAGNGTIMALMEAYTDMERPADAIESFMRLWEGRKLSAILYNILIKAYREYALEMRNSQEVDPITALSFHIDGPPELTNITTPLESLHAVVHVTEYMRNHGLANPDPASYNALMDFTAEMGDWATLLLLEERRAAAGFRTDHWVIHAKMKCLAEMGNLEGVMSVKDEMEWRNIPANEYTFSVLTLSLLKCGSVDQAEELLRTALTRAVPVHESLPITFMFYFAQTGEVHRLNKLLHLYRDRLVWGSANVWEAVLGSFATLGDVERCELVFQGMVKTMGSRPSRKSFLFMVRAFCVAKDPVGAIAWLERMKRARYPVEEAYSWALGACVAARDAGRLQSLLAAMETDGIKSDRLTARLRARIMEVLTSTLRSTGEGLFGRLQQLVQNTTPPPPSDDAAAAAASGSADQSPSA